MSNFKYLKLKTDEQATGYARVLAHSFGRLETESRGWIDKFGRDGIRLLAGGRSVDAGLILIPMGQFWGGRSVPMTGVAAVGVAPEARGAGAATRLMQDALREMHDDGVATSTLYPATQKLYRGVGYEQAGCRMHVRLPLPRIDGRDRSMAMRPMTEEDKDAVRALYRDHATGHNGNLDRAPIIWDRIERPPPTRTDPARAFVVTAGAGQGGSVKVKRRHAKGGGGTDSLEGYIYLTQVMADEGKHEVHVHDMVASTPRAARRLISFLAAYGTMGTDLIWFAGNGHPLLAMLAEQPYRITLRHFWMVRIVNVQTALEARGYPAGMEAGLSIEVVDELLPGNSGTYRLEVAGGRATASKGRGARGGKNGRSAPVVRVTPNGLAALYAGFMPAASLRVMGQLACDDESAAAADAIFSGAGGTPWMSDMF